MWTSGFFNSVNGDRPYNSDQMSDIFEGLITNGVYARVGNKLAVQPNNGLTIQINTGLGWFARKWARNTSEYLLTLENADVLLNRYCAVCVRTDLNTESRTAEPYLKYSEFASAPVKPSMERSDTVNEFCLAYVYIPAGATEITASMIEDTRSNTDLCGWVTGIIDQLDSTTLFAQFEGAFLEWFNSLADYIDDDVETKLAADMLEVKATAPVKSIGTFDGLGWDSQDDGSYLQTVTIEGVTEDNDILIAPTDEFKEAYFNQGCEAIAQGENSVTFRCYYPDDISMQVKAIIFNDKI
jgi:hypothetical protein